MNEGLPRLWLESASRRPVRTLSGLRLEQVRGCPDMTRVRRPTSGFMSEAALETHSKLRDQPRQKGPWTSPSCAARVKSLPSDVSPRFPFAGARASTTTQCTSITEGRR